MFLVECEVELAFVGISLFSLYSYGHATTSHNHCLLHFISTLKFSSAKHMLSFRDFLEIERYIFHCRQRELHTLKGHVESVVKLKGLDIETIQQSYTV